MNVFMYMRIGRKEDEEITPQQPYMVLKKREWNPDEVFSCRNYSKTRMSNQYAKINNAYRK